MIIHIINALYVDNAALKLHIAVFYTSFPLPQSQILKSRRNDQHRQDQSS
jgi:hypothetical protein